MEPARASPPRGYFREMNTALAVVIVLLVVLNVVLVGCLFLWAAMKDGEYDKATQKRLGIRRRSRLGR